MEKEILCTIQCLARVLSSIGDKEERKRILNTIENLSKYKKKTKKRTNRGGGGILG